MPGRPPSRSLLELAARQLHVQPIGRVGGWDTPYPHAFEWEYFPGPHRVAAGLKALMEAR